MAPLLRALAVSRPDVGWRWANQPVTPPASQPLAAAIADTGDPVQPRNVRTSISATCLPLRSGDHYNCYISIQKQEEKQTNNRTSPTVSRVISFIQISRFCRAAPTEAIRVAPDYYLRESRRSALPIVIISPPPPSCPILSAWFIHSRLSSPLSKRGSCDCN